MKRILFFLLVALTCLSLTKKQQKFGECLTSSGLSTVKAATIIHWYGLDLSRVCLVEGKRINEGARIKHELGPAFIQRFKKEISTKYIQRKLKKTAVDCTADFEFTRLDSANPATIVNYRPAAYNLDTISSMLSTYKLKETSGVGMCIVVGNLVKQTEAAEDYFVFFDIATKKPLWVCKTLGQAGGYGMADFWSTGINGGFTRFRELFLKDLKRK